MIKPLHWSVGVNKGYPVMSMSAVRGQSLRVDLNRALVFTVSRVYLCYCLKVS